MDINIFLAFGAGLLSFVSPCVLPLFPAFVSYITGMSISELDQGKQFNYKSIIHTICFLLGFSIIFMLIGLSSTFATTFLITYGTLIRQLSALLIIFFGLVIVGILNFEFLMRNRQIQFKNRPSGFIGSFVIGLGFALGWTPCTGPILASVFGLASTQPDMYFIMMISYVLGFAIPFFILSFFIGKLDHIKRHSQKIVKIGGYFMILVGVMLLFDWMTWLTAYLAELTGFKGF